MVCHWGTLRDLVVPVTLKEVALMPRRTIIDSVVGWRCCTAVILSNPFPIYLFMFVCMFVRRIFAAANRRLSARRLV